MTYDEACRSIVANKEIPALNYAVAYASAQIGMVGQERKVQALYILNNITYWRGDEAKQVRAALKEASR